MKPKKNETDNETEKEPSYYILINNPPTCSFLRMKIILVSYENILVSYEKRRCPQIGCPMKSTKLFRFFIFKVPCYLSQSENSLIYRLIGSLPSIAAGRNSIVDYFHH